MTERDVFVDEAREETRQSSEFGGYDGKFATLPSFDIILKTVFSPFWIFAVHYGVVSGRYKSQLRYADTSVKCMSA